MNRGWFTSLKSILSQKMFLKENEFKTPYGCLNSFSSKNIFNDKTDLILFYFSVMKLQFQEQ